MEPNHNNPAVLPELPNPQDDGAVEQATTLPASPEVSVNLASQAPPSVATASASAQTMSQPTTPLSQPGTQSMTHSTPAIADDSDLIEKEWVMKAKAIVAATKDDPYTQNKEMNKVKADYMKKRYNKDLKISDN